MCHKGPLHSTEWILTLSSFRISFSSSFVIWHDSQGLHLKAASGSIIYKMKQNHEDTAEENVVEISSPDICSRTRSPRFPVLVMCNRFRCQVPVYPRGRQKGDSTASPLHQLRAKGCLLPLLTRPTGGTHVNHCPIQDFSWFLQTQALYKLASMFKSKVLWVLYGDPFSFITSRDIYISKPHSFLHLDCTTNNLQGGTLLDSALTSITRLLPPHFSYIKPLHIKIIYFFGHLCHSACVQSRGTLVRADSTMWHQNSGHYLW